MIQVTHCGFVVLTKTSKSGIIPRLPKREDKRQAKGSPLIGVVFLYKKLSTLSFLTW